MDQIKAEHPGVAGQQMARNFAQMFGVAPELARLSSEEFHKLMQDMKEVGPDPIGLVNALKDAEAFNHEFVKTKAIFDGWKTYLETWLLPPSTKIVGGVNELLLGDWLKARPGPFPGGATIVPNVAPALPSPRAQSTCRTTTKLHAIHSTFCAGCYC